MNKETLLQLEKPQPICSECGAPIEELNHHPSRLRLAEEEARRADFCPDCWEFAKSEIYDSYWVTRRIHKSKKMPKLTRREKAVAARALFESLWDQREREDVDEHLFFLSHLLMKWGGLKWVRDRRDDQGREVIVFENPATGDPIEIRGTDITEEKLEEIRERIEAFLREFAPENDVSI